MSRLRYRCWCVAEHVIARIVYIFGIHMLTERYMGARIICVGYHRIVSEDAAIGENEDMRMIVRGRQFIRQLQYLRRRGYTFMNITELARAYQSGNIPKTRIACVYFDDGFLDTFQIAVPILRHMHIPATFFVTTDFISEGTRDAEHGRVQKKRQYISWGELRTLSSDIAVASHACTHRKFTKLDIKDVQEELVKSREIIKENAGRDAYAFSFPHSAASPTHIRQALYAGYTLVIVGALGANTFPVGNVLAKIPVSGKDTLLMFKVKISTLYIFRNALIGKMRARQYDK